MKIINILLVILWMTVIFCFSHDMGDTSSKKSDGITRQIISYINDNTNVDIGKVENIVTFVVRKLAHILEYLILGILVMNVLKDYYNINYKYCLISLLICYIYSCTDEFHQLFIPGRSGKLVDTFIDLFGSVIGVFSYNLLRNNVKFKK